MLLPTLQTDCHYLLLSFQSPAHRPATSLHTLLSVDDLASPYTARTEATHTKCFPPGHHNRVHIFPWTSLPFLPLYHWDEGALLLPMAVSPHAVFITALLLLLFRLFPASWVSPSLLDLHHCTDSFYWRMLLETKTWAISVIIVSRPSQLIEQKTMCLY